MLAFKFRLYPNQEEERKLLWTLEVCSCTYNSFLGLYRNGEHDRAKLQAMLPVRKETNHPRNKFLGFLARNLQDLAILRLIGNVSTRHN